MTFDEARHEIRKVRWNLTAAQQQRDEIDGEIEAYQGVIDELVEPFIPPYSADEKPDRDPAYEVPGTWPCPDERNPAGTCVYDDANDPCHDFCRFCGHPEERK